MGIRKVIMGNHAVSYGAMLARSQVIAAYPITPQTQVVELLSEICSDGRLDARFLKVESEHSAMACCLGASVAGCRAFTATSAQGLALMHELLHWAGLGRMPVVLANINRAMAPGWSIWTDQTDSLSQRDTGLMQIYCEDNQEVVDTVILAFKIAEKVMLPCMLTFDAFLLSHTSEPVDMPEQELVDEFLPPFTPKYKLDPDDPPYAFGPLTSPDHYMELRFNMQQAMREALDLFEEEGRKFEKLFGRYYGLIEEYRTEDAKILFLVSSSNTGTTRVVVDQLRAEGEAVGLVKVRVLRPLPTEHIRKALSGCERVAVIDRNISVGVGGIFAQEIRAALFGMENPPMVFNYIAGLGGRDIRPTHIREIYQNTRDRQSPGAEILWNEVHGLDGWIAPPPGEL